LAAPCIRVRAEKRGLLTYPKRTDRVGLRIVLALVALALAPEAGATDCSVETCRYVRQGATGSGSGADWSNACSDFVGACATSSLIRGATYYVADGIYAARSWDRAASGTTVITIKKAIPADHGTSTAWTDAFGDGQVVFAGANTVATSYWTFDGQKGDYLAGGIASYGFKFDFSEGQVAITNRGDFNTFRYIDFDGITATGDRNYTAETKALAAYGGNNWTLSHSALHGGESLIQGGGNNWVVEYSYFYNSRSIASNFHANVFYASEINGGVFRYNRIWDYNSEGLFFTGFDGPVSNVKIYGNVFFTDGTTAFPRGIELRQDYGYSNIQIYNNTFSRLGVGGILNRSPETGHVCSNCISRDNLSYQAANTLAGMTRDNNTDDNTIRFRNLAGGDFTLTAALPGAALAAEFNMDVNGTSRGFDGVWDRGAYEFGRASNLAPLAPTNPRIIP
jgi:hypothetical protein